MNLDAKKLTFFEKFLRRLVAHKIEHGHVDIVVSKARKSFADNILKIRKMYAQGYSSPSSSLELLGENNNDYYDNNPPDADSRQRAKIQKAFMDEDVKILTDLGFLWKNQGSRIIPGTT
jgi:hypothetical protein